MLFSWTESSTKKLKYPTHVLTDGEDDGIVSSPWALINLTCFANKSYVCDGHQGPCCLFILLFAPIW